MKDNFGDRISVSSYEGSNVFLDCKDGDFQRQDMALTPKKARKLAKKLKRAARVAESYATD